MTERIPLVVVIAGPNGAGKSTMAPRMLQGALAVSEFVNTDTIARGLSAFPPESVALAAGRNHACSAQGPGAGAGRLRLRDDAGWPQLCAVAQRAAYIRIPRTYPVHFAAKSRAGTRACGRAC